MSDEKKTPATTDDVELTELLHEDEPIVSKIEDLDPVVKNKNGDEVNEETAFLDPASNLSTDTHPIEVLTPAIDESDAIELEQLNPATDATVEEAEKIKKTKVERLARYLSSTRPARFRAIGIVVLVITISSLFGLFIYKSLETVPYDKIALSRNLITGRLYSERTYTSGLHFLMPWNEFLYFQRPVHSIKLQRLRILTKDKLEVVVYLDIFYFINSDELGLLYRKFGEEYKPLMNNVARSSVLSEGQKFTIVEYRSKRDMIYKALKGSLKELFAKYHFKLLNIYVASINFGREISGLNLKRVLNDIQNEKAVYTKKIALTIAETNVQVSEFKNKARYELSNGTAASNLFVKSAGIDYTYVLENIHSAELNYSLNELNYKIGSYKNVLKHRLSYVYLYALLNHKQLVVYPHDYAQRTKAF